MFVKGMSGNPQGRTPGAKDKSTKEIRERFNDLLENNLSNIEKWLTATAEKDPAKALDLLLKLSEFVVPKLKAADLNLNSGQDMVITVIPPKFD